MAHPAVAEASVIAVPHPKWDERPMAFVVLKPLMQLSAKEIEEFIAPRSRNGGCPTSTSLWTPFHAPQPASF